MGINDHFLVVEHVYNTACKLRLNVHLWPEVYISRVVEKGGAGGEAGGGIGRGAPAPPPFPGAKILPFHVKSENRKFA